MNNHIPPLNFFQRFDVLKQSIARLTPAYQLRNPVMFVVYLSAILTSVETVRLHHHYPLAVAIVLWLTVLSANLSECYAEKRGQIQAEGLRKTRQDTQARRLYDPERTDSYEVTLASFLRKDDLFYVKEGDLIPADGQIIKGIASVDESAITGESAPVIRESDSERDTVTAGTRILSDWLVVRVMRDQGHSYLDKMISMVKGSHRQKTPNEVALTIMLTAMTFLFFVTAATLLPFTRYAVEKAGGAATISITSLVALLIAWAPTTIGGLLSTISIAGINRLMNAHIMTISSHAIEVAGDVTTLLFDKTGTITHGNRHAVAFYPALGVSPTELIDGALWASMTDTTPEGRSILELAQKQHGLTPEVTNEDVVTIPFSAETRVSGATIGERAYLKGAIDTIESYVTDLGGMIPPDVKRQANLIAQQGGTPLIVAQGAKILGTIHLKDVIKSGIRERLISLRIMGIKTMMLTGDNPLTAAAIASETGVDDFLAETTPKAKLALIRKMQKEGQVVAMIGDGTNDAPALAQADVALAMNKGTQAAKEAATMIDLESDPCKIIDVIKLGREMLMTRGALATFSYTNDLVKFFVVSGPVLAMVYPSLAGFNLLHLSSAHNAVLATLIYNAIVILFLAPVAFHGVRYRVIAAELILRRNLLLFGMGGFIVPAITIKLLDIILVAMGGF